MYMDVLVEVLLRCGAQRNCVVPFTDRVCRFVLSEPKKSGTSSVPIANIQVQSSALDLLRAVVTKGDVDPLTLDNVEAAIIGKLYVSVHSERMELQNKLLHVLHSVILASTGNDPAKPEHSSRFDRTQTGGALAGEAGEQLLNSPISSKVNPLLVQTLVDGISKAANRPVLQHWVDFILMTIPRFQQSASNLIFPLSDATCRQLRVGLEDLVRTYADSHTTANIRSFTTDSDLIVLFNALERLVLLGLTKSENGSVEDDTASVQERVAVESSGLLGLVSNVFSSDSASVQEEHLVVSTESLVKSRHYLTFLLDKVSQLLLLGRSCPCSLCHLDNDPTSPKRCFVADIGDAITPIFKGPPALPKGFRAPFQSAVCGGPGVTCRMLESRGRYNCEILLFMILARC